MLFRSIQQRNALLREARFAGSRESTLDVLDEQLLPSATYVIAERRKFLQELNTLAGAIHTALTEGKETCRLAYEPNATEEALAEALRAHRESDLARGTSTTGPHRDDFRVMASNEGTSDTAVENKEAAEEDRAEQEFIDLRHFGSQGQQRTAALALKLSEIELVKRRTGEEPILLLDDVLSELDAHRQTQLLQNIEHVQTFLTCTGMEDLLTHAFPEHRVFRIDGGIVLP